MSTATAVLIIIISLNGQGKAASIDHVEMASMDACAAAEAAVEQARTEGGVVDAVCVENGR